MNIISLYLEKTKCRARMHVFGSHCHQFLGAFQIYPEGETGPEAVNTCELGMFSLFSCSFEIFSQAVNNVYLFFCFDD